MSHDSGEIDFSSKNGAINSSKALKVPINRPNSRKITYEEMVWMEEQSEDGEQEEPGNESQDHVKEE